MHAGNIFLGFDPVLFAIVRNRDALFEVIDVSVDLKLEFDREVVEVWPGLFDIHVGILCLVSEVSVRAEDKNDVEQAF